jgi:hypothetical protein
MQINLFDPQARTKFFHHHQSSPSPLPDQAQDTKMSQYPENNLTWQIVHDAQKRGYAVGGFCV